jgi:hypothetical protein
VTCSLAARQTDCKHQPSDEGEQSNAQKRRSPAEMRPKKSTRRDTERYRNGHPSIDDRERPPPPRRMHDRASQCICARHEEAGGNGEQYASAHQSPIRRGCSGK